MTLYAPCGLDDIENMIIRPNPVPNFDAERYEEKARRWTENWPELKVVSAR